MPDISARSGRFSARVLQAYSAAGLPEGLTVRAAANDDPTEILIYDEIGFWGVTAKEFAAALSDVPPGKVRVRINSPGGDVFDGLAIHNALKARGDVEVVIDGLAASAASFIAMAGESVTIADTAFIMIHNAWGIVVGNRHDLSQTAATLAKIDGQLAGIYAAKSGKAVADLSAAMDKETWYTGDEAKEAGLVDTVLSAGTKPAAAKKPGGAQASAEDRDRRRRLARWASASG